VISPNGGYLTARGARSAGVVLVPSVFVGQEFVASILACEDDVKLLFVRTPIETYVYGLHSKSRASITPRLLCNNFCVKNNMKEYIYII